MPGFALLTRRGNRLRFALLPLLLLLALLAPPSVRADESPEASTLSAEELAERIAALKEEIEEFTRLLEESRSERAQVERELKANEKQIGATHERIAAILADLALRRRRLVELSDERRELVAARAEQQQYIGQQVRAAYKVGRQEYLKILLNQENPSQISRMLKYYDYFNRARAEQVDRYNATLASLREVELQISEETARLEEDQAALEVRRRDLVGQQERRRVTLATLNALITDRDAELRRRSADRERLEELLARIRQSIADLPAPYSVVPFPELKGKMELPVTGSIANRFGSQNRGNVKWNGVFIAADAGEPVHAIHYGRVVFADWLRGFGLMVIIDHGDGYMSLYGHNEAIFRETGDWVQAGDVVGSAGNSGGLERTGLYFEIRVSGRPTDPLGWCMARTSGPA